MAERLSYTQLTVDRYHVRIHPVSTTEVQDGSNVKVVVQTTQGTPSIKVMHPVEARRKAAQYRQGAPGVEVAARPAQVGEESRLYAVSHIVHFCTICEICVAITSVVREDRVANRNDPIKLG